MSIGLIIVIIGYLIASFESGVVQSNALLMGAWGLLAMVTLLFAIAGAR